MLSAKTTGGNSADGNLFRSRDYRVQPFVTNSPMILRSYQDYVRDLRATIERMLQNSKARIQIVNRRNSFGHNRFESAGCRSSRQAWGGPLNAASCLANSAARLVIEPTFARYIRLCIYQRDRWPLRAFYI